MFYEYLCTGALCMFYGLEKSIKIAFEPKTLNKSGEWLTVSWIYVENPSNLDWLGMWVLPDGTSDINAKTQAPVKYQVIIKIF